MTLTRLSLHPRQYLQLKEPLRIFFGKSQKKEITESEFEIIRESLAKRKTPLVITAKQINGNQGKIWQYRLEMPTYSVKILEGNEKVNLQATQFQSAEGDNRGYRNRYQQMFFIEVTEGIYLIYHGETFYVSPDGEWRICDRDEHVDWNMSLDAYNDMIERMHTYFSEEEEYIRSQKVSENMKINVMDPFEQYTQKEHEFETKKVDFTQGVPYSAKLAARGSHRKKRSYELICTDPSVDPENCPLAAGQRVAIYREDESFTGLAGLLVAMDTTADDGIHFILEFYQEIEDKDFPDSGRLFVHQNDTQLKIRQNVAKSIYRNKTPAKYIYKTFHDFSVRGYEDLEEKHPGLVDFLCERMGREYPPNQMQLEAIVKGILTEDLLLVLGPPGTGKTTVILSWVEYFLSRGKRVLISSQNNSAVDNVLDRLADDENLEIVRLGREEKVQENCQKFMPERRIKTMRDTCENNGRRLEESLSREMEQIDAYMEAMTQLRDRLAEATLVSGRIRSHAAGMEKTCADVQSFYTEMNQTKDTMVDYRSRVERYAIYLEESDKKPFLTRLLQFAERRRARKELERMSKSIPALERKARQMKQQYIDSWKKLERQNLALRQEGLTARYRQLREEINGLHGRILGGLVPEFHSELKNVRQMGGFVYPALADLKDTAFLGRQLQVMEEVRVSAGKILEASRHWVSAALKSERSEVFDEILLEACQVVGATCIGINSNKLFREVEFDVTIIDESGQIQLQNALVPISRAPKTLMLGDYKQIPPIVNADIVESCRMEDISTELFEQSFFEYLFEEMRHREIERLAKQYRSEQENSWEALPDPWERARKELLRPRVEDYIGKSIKHTVTGEDGTERTSYSSRYSHEEVEEMVGRITRDRKKLVNLNSQFRMPGHISDVISEWFYENNYNSSYDMNRFRPIVPGTDLPMVIIDTSGMRGRFEGTPENRDIRQNTAEAELVADVLEKVLTGMSEEQQYEYLQSLDKRLGVISAYSAQVRHIRQTLCRRLGLSKNEAATAVATLDSFQGQERDLIIYSLTRSDRKRSEQARVGFLKELRRLNVAFTRCKKQLVIIGDMDYLLGCMYLPKDLDRDEMPCAGTDDDWIGQTHIDQCAECKADCERRVARFFRLLLQHVRADEPAGNLIPAEQFKQSMKGVENHAE